MIAGGWVIPIRDRDGELRGVLCYAPSHDHVPKVLAVRGTRLRLVPHLCTESSAWVVLVEGLPDMISARSRGLPAIAVPSLAGAGDGLLVLTVRLALALWPRAPPCRSTPAAAPGPQPPHPTCLGAEAIVPCGGDRLKLR